VDGVSEVEPAVTVEVDEVDDEVDEVDEEEDDPK